MRTLIALLALAGCAHAQTYKTVTADTNNVIRTNFSLVRSQVSDLSGASFAISNVAGLQTALDGKLSANGSAAALTNFPALLLTTNSSASAFPSGLLRTNGDGSGLTNLPNANLSNASGVLPLSNGGTGSTNASAARFALQLGSAATNDASAFQPANTNLTELAAGNGSNLTNVTVTDASSLTNFPASLLRTNGSAAALTNFPAELLRTNGDGSNLTNVSVDLTTVLPSYSGNDGKVLAVANGETNVAWTAISNTVTDASTLTNFPASILQTNSADGSFPAFLLRTNGSAAALTSFPALLLATNGSALGLTNFPMLNQNTTGTASNVTGVVAIANGGSGQTTAAAAIEAFLPAYSGNANRILALNSNANGLVWTTNAGGGGGIVNLADTTNGVTNTLRIANGGTEGTNAQTALESLTILAGGGSAGARNGVALGRNSITTANGVAIGLGASAYGNSYNVVIGDSSFSTGGDNVVIGRLAAITNASSCIAIGVNAKIPDSYADGSIQIGPGTMSAANSVQFNSWGLVNSAEWGYLASASAKGGSRLTSTNGLTVTNTIVGYNGTNYTTNTIIVIDGIITSWTQ